MLTFAILCLTLIPVVLVLLGVGAATLAELSGGKGMPILRAALAAVLVSLLAGLCLIISSVLPA